MSVKSAEKHVFNLHQTMVKASLLSAEIAQGTAQIDGMFQVAESQLEEAVELSVAVMGDLDGKIEFWKAQAQEAAEVRKRCEVAKEQLKNLIKNYMTTNQLDELAGKANRFKLSELKPILKIDDAKLLPEQFLKIETTKVPAKEQLLVALLSGAEVSGARLECPLTLRTYKRT